MGFALLELIKRIALLTKYDRLFVTFEIASHVGDARCS